MFKPETSVTGFGDKVIVLTDNDVGYAFGTYTGNKRDKSESYEIRTIDALTGDTVGTSFYHKEDIFETATTDLDTIREMV